MLGSIGVAWRGWVLAQNRLPGWVEAALTDALQRPVEIGELEALGPGIIRFGPSAIPATPTDPDSLALDAIDIRFNLLELLRRELNLTITLDDVNAYLEQDADRQWIALEIEPPAEEDRPQERLIGVRIGGITIKPQTIRLNDGTLTAIPLPPAGTNPITVTYQAVQSRVEFSDATVADPAGERGMIETQQLDFTANGKSAQGGELDLQGSVLLPPLAQERTSSLEFPDPTAAEGMPEPGLDSAPRPPAVHDWIASRWQVIGHHLLPGTQRAWASSSDADPKAQVKLNLRAQETRVADVMPIVESFLDGSLPVQFPTGLVSGSADFESNGDDPWTLNGMARVREGTVVTGGLPAPVQELGGDVRFRGQIFEFEGVTARLGELTAEAGGTLDLQSGYDLAGQFDPFTLAQVTELFEVDLPVDVDGSFGADVTMTGPLKKPLLVTDIAAQNTVTVDQVPFSSLNATAVLQAPKLDIENVRAVPQAGGTITGSGLYTFGDPGNLALSLTGDSLPADALGRPYGLPETLTIGSVFVDASVNGPVDQLVTTATWRAPTGTYPARGDLRFANGTLQVTDTFVQVAGGTVSGNGTLANRRWSADVNARGVQLRELGAGVSGELTANAQLTGSLDTPTLAGIQGQGTATAALAGGNINAQGNLAGGRWTADVQGNDLRLAAFSPNLQGTGRGIFALSGTTDNLSLAGTRAQGQVVLSDGLATAAPLAPQLAAVQEPLVADLSWTGNVIQVQQARTAGININGTVTPQLQGPAAPSIANLDLNLDIQNYSLAALPLPDVVPVGGNASFNGRLTGSLNTLNLMGNATLADLTVSELAFASPLTGPVFYSRQEGLTVDLVDPDAGPDRIQVAANRGDTDLDFLVVSGDAEVEGFRQGDQLQATIQNLPLDGLKLPPGGVDGIGTVSGTLASATIDANLRAATFETSFDIVDPGLGYISLQTVEVASDLPPEEMPEEGSSIPGSPLSPEPILETRYGRITGNVSFANNVLTLRTIDLLSASGVSRYMATGTITLGDIPEVNTEVFIRNGEIQDILLTLKIFELADFRLNPLKPPAWYRPIPPEEVADLRPNPVGDPDASLLEQIRRWAELDELRTIQIAQQEAEPFPPLDELRGTFSGFIRAEGPLTEEIEVTTELNGRDWIWGTVASPNIALLSDGLPNSEPEGPVVQPIYKIDEITVQGRYQDQVITLNPLRLRSTPPGIDPENGQVAIARLNGEFSLDRDDPVTRTMELDVANVPLEALRRPLRVPPNLNGNLNIGATLTGSLDNPQVRGRLRVSEATINREEITEASANFLYKDALLNLIANLAVADNQETPLQLEASIPYQLSFASQPPQTRDLRVDLRVQDEGFALVNLFTQAVVWESGEANLNLNLTGQVPQGNDLADALTSLSVGGGATLDGVTISSNLLPEPLTNIKGDIRVVNDRGSGLPGTIYRTGLVLDFANVRGEFSDGEVVAQGDLKVIPSINDLYPGLIDDGAPLPAAPVNSNPLADGEASAALPGPGAGDPNSATEAPPSLSAATSPEPTSLSPEPPPPPTSESDIPEAPTLLDETFRVALNDIDLALKGVYDGSVEGEVVVDGSVFLLGPLINGEVRLANGTISLPETGANGQGTLPMAGRSGDVSVFRPLPPTFNDFNVTLADNVQVAIAGVIDVKAQGSLDLVGTLPEVQPVGRINLPSGRVNLLTTAFRLTGNDNYAEFRPGDDKIDPYLVATLSTAIPDTAGAGNTLSIASPFPRNEISDAELNQLGLTQGGVETIRIQARVDGRVSRVTKLQGVELSSTPPRSDDAIVSLISGGVLTALESTIGSVSGGGDSFQGLIALAGSALLNNIQDILGDSLNLSELRLFSATPQSAQNAGDLDIGGEVGVNLSPNISVSVQKVFTNVTPAVFNVRYRINDNLTLRGVTSYEQFNENTGALLEIQF